MKRFTSNIFLAITSVLVGASAAHAESIALFDSGWVVSGLIGDDACIARFGGKLQTLGVGNTAIYRPSKVNDKPAGTDCRGGVVRFSEEMIADQQKYETIFTNRCIELLEQGKLDGATSCDSLVPFRYKEGMFGTPQMYETFEFKNSLGETVVIHQMVGGARVWDPNPGSISTPTK